MNIRILYESLSLTCVLSLTKYCVIILFTIALMFYSHLKQLSCYKNLHTLHICQFRFPFPFQAHSHFNTTDALTEQHWHNPAHFKRNSTVAFRRTANIGIYFKLKKTLQLVKLSYVLSRMATQHSIT
jgi:hypothetical protein